MIHDHACVGPAATYCAIGAIAFGLSVFAVCTWIGLGLAGRLWAALGEAEERTRVRL